jgi:hypothetical protein
MSAACRWGDEVEEGLSVGRLSHEELLLGREVGRWPFAAMFESSTLFLRIQTLVARKGERWAVNSVGGTRGSFLSRNNIGSTGRT